MTRLPSPSSRSSSKSSFPLDLAFDLTAHLQAVSFQPSVTECVVLPNSTALGAGIPSLLPSLADEGLVSPTEIVSSGVGIDHDKVRLTQPGASNFEEKPF